uniref:Uncharacterized protein n=1 Tax=viral metagenome TaxID=1070528 RepID=A0A6C0J7C3_9ZZZZ
MGSDKKDMVKLNAKTITFDKICQLNDIYEIDTEGFEIIQMIDFIKYKISKI